VTLPAITRPRLQVPPNARGVGGEAELKPWSVPTFCVWGRLIWLAGVDEAWIINASGLKLEILTPNGELLAYHRLSVSG